MCFDPMCAVMYIGCMTRLLLYMGWAGWMVGCTSSTNGSGDDTQPPGQVNVYPTVFDFGAVGLHTEHSQTFSITNIGEGPLTVYDVTFSDDTRRPHWQLHGGRSGVLEPDASVDLDIFLRPVDLSDPSVSLLVRTDDPINPAVQLLLNAQTLGWPTIRLEPNLLDFGLVSVGDEVTAQIRIYNDGTEPLHIGALSFANVPDDHFRVTVSAADVTIDPDTDDGLIEVAFSPQQAGALTNQLLIESDDPNQPTLSVLVSGQGIP